MDSEFENFLGPGQAYASLAIGFDAWRGLPRVPDMVIRPGRPATLGHHAGHSTNGIYLLRDWPYEAAKLAVTIVTYEMDTGRLLDADIVVNGQAKFALLPEPVVPGVDAYDLAAVLTHEAGHVLGLGESAAGQQATMWPYARPDDVDKRTLDVDDEDGAIESYQSAPPPAAGGCGSNSVGGRVSGHGGLGMSLWLLALLPLVRLSRRQRRRVLGAAGLVAVVLLFGFDTQSAEPTPEQRQIATIEALMRDGTRDDVATAEALSSSADAEIAHRARYAIGTLLARPGALRVAADSLQGNARMKLLLGTGKRLWVGHASRLHTVNANGLLFTDYRVVGQDGTSTTLRVPGGEQDGVAQRVMDAEPPPADDQELAIVPQADGSKHWSYYRAGLLFGGHLGDGPAISGAL